MTARRAGSWEQTILRGLEWVANPALAGLAFCLLSLGVITWLPALAACAHALNRWRTDGDQSVFVGTFKVFGTYWRSLWRHALLSTTVVAVLSANLLFLGGRTSLLALAFLAIQAGILIVLVPYHLALAAVAARDKNGTAMRWARTSLLLAFSGRRGPTLLAATALAVLVSLPLAIGPFLFGPTLPLLLALALAERSIVLEDNS